MGNTELTEATTPRAEANTGADFDLVIRGKQIVTGAGTVAREIGVRDGKIVAIEPLGNNLSGTQVIELSAEEVLIPGLVDTHVHVNEPGRTEWEGFESATKAAAAGGVTTIVDMPLNSIPPTVNVEALELKQDAARPRPSWMSDSGAVRSRATSRICASSTMPGSSASNASCSTPASRNSRTSSRTRWKRTWPRSCPLTR